MKRQVIVASVITGIILFGAVGSVARQAQPSTTGSAQTTVVEKAIPVCDGTNITKSCSVDGVNYSTYIYHPAVAEKSHDETVTTYERKVTSYCTLCNDGTYSPSCATGRGTCSYHGGVAEWNAPRYSNVPTYSTKKVIDTAAQDAYYEKIVQ